MGIIKSMKGKGKSLKKVASKLTSLGKGRAGKSPSKRRRKGPEYWAKRLLTERLKKRYWKVKYGGR